MYAPVLVYNNLKLFLYS